MDERNKTDQVNSPTETRRMSLAGDTSLLINVPEGTSLLMLATVEEEARGTITVTVGASSSFASRIACGSGAPLDLTYDITLLRGAHADIQTAAASDAPCKQSFTTHVHHSGANSTSLLMNYAAARGEATLWMDTDGTIAPGATGVVCRQKTRGLVVAGDAVISSAPWLRISWFDSSAFHGVAIGELSDEELFYLASRGLSEEEARLMLTLGFMDPFLRALPVEDRDAYKALLERRIRR